MIHQRYSCFPLFMVRREVENVFGNLSRNINLNNCFRLFLRQIIDGNNACPSLSQMNNWAEFKLIQNEQQY